MSKGWDSNMLKKLKALVGKGLSASEIGKKLEVSKNAVIGKLNRLGWNSKAVDTTDKKSAKSKKEVKETKTSKKVVAKKNSLKDVLKKVVKKGKKAPLEKSVVKPVKKVVETKKAPKADKADKKTLVVENPVIKTASKKTKKDLALHELLIQHALQMANLKPNQCRWPIGDPDSDNFHFCGETVFAGKPYCYEHCRQAYQFTAPKKK